jgi:hypothetical protein
MSELSIAEAIEQHHDVRTSVRNQCGQVGAQADMRRLTSHPLFDLGHQIEETAPVIGRCRGGVIRNRI